MSIPEMTRLEEEKQYLNVSMEFIRFILCKNEITASFQQHYDDVVHAMSNANAARLYMDG